MKTVVSSFPSSEKWLMNCTARIFLVPWKLLIVVFGYGLEINRIRPCLNVFGSAYGFVLSGCNALPSAYHSFRNHRFSDLLLGLPVATSHTIFNFNMLISSLCLPKYIRNCLRKSHQHRYDNIFILRKLFFNYWLMNIFYY